MRPEVRRASFYAYAGGRADLWQYGYHRREFLTHDIRSAYPYFMLQLPSLRVGDWVRTKELDSKYPFALYKVNFDCTKQSRGYPFFLRLKSGHIFYPPRVVGWYWKPEIDAALSTGFSTAVDILDGWQFRPGEDHPPFGFMQSEFEHRKRAKAEGRQGVVQVLKLGMNAGYGKVAQTVGGTDGQPPALHELTWAGYITSSTRARVFEVAMQNPDAIGFIATDGIGATERLDVHEGKELGEWDITAWKQAVLVQAGVYFLLGNCGECEKCKGNDEAWVHEKYRGFDKSSLQVLDILQAWERGDTTLPVPATRFITFGSALRSEKSWTDWRKWRTLPRDLDLWGGGGKRENNGAHDKPHKGLCKLTPTELDENKIRSARFPVKWLGEEWDEPKIDGVSETTFFNEVTDSVFS